MKIETAPPLSFIGAAKRTSPVLLPPDFRSTLVSPHAPTWGGFVASCLKWVWEKVSLFFRWFLPKKKESPSPIPPEIVLTHRKAQAEKKAHQNPLPSLIIGGAISGGFSWLMGTNQPFVMYVANRTTTGSAYVLEKIANYILPSVSIHRKKVGSLAIATSVVWIGADRLGYPLGYLFLISMGITANGILSQGNAQEKEKKLLRLSQL